MGHQVLGILTIFQIEAAVYVLNYKDGAVVCGKQHFPELGVVMYARGLQVIYGEVQIISHCCYQAGFPCSWRTMQQVI